MDENNPAWAIVDNMSEQDIENPRALFDAFIAEHPPLDYEWVVLLIEAGDMLIRRDEILARAPD